MATAMTMVGAMVLPTSLATAEAILLASARLY